LGEIDAARGVFQEAMTIADELIDSQPSSPHARRDLVMLHYKLGFAEQHRLNHDLAFDHYNSAILLLELMIDSEQHVERSQQEMQAIMSERDKIAGEADHARAMVGDWNEFLSREEAVAELPLRIMLLARRDRLADAVHSIQYLRELAPDDPTNLYNTAGGYALCANAIQPAGETELSPELEGQRQEYVDLAFECLRESIAAGWSHFEYMQQDPNLSILRELPEFADLMPMSEPGPPAD
jgi:hypothetical protein